MGSSCTTKSGFMQLNSVSSPFEVRDCRLESTCLYTVRGKGVAGHEGKSEGMQFGDYCLA